MHVHEKTREETEDIGKRKMVETERKNMMGKETENRSKTKK